MTEINCNDLYGKSGIYAIVNNLDGKMYIGRSVDLGKRKYTHFWRLRTDAHKNIHLQRAYNLNPESFVFKVLELCDRKQLNDREIYYIDKYQSMKEGYNLCEGGGTTTGYHFTDEQKKKISEGNKGKKHSPETIKKRTASLKKHLAEDSDFAKQYYEAIRNNLKGNAWNKGRKLSEEHKQKISRYFKGRKKMSDEGKKKLSELYRGANAVGAKLNDNEVAKMRLRFLKGEKRMAIAKDYPFMHPTTIWQIITNKRWLHIPNIIEELEELLNGRKEVQL